MYVSDGQHNQKYIMLSCSAVSVADPDAQVASEDGGVNDIRMVGSFNDKVILFGAHASSENLINLIGSTT